MKDNMIFKNETNYTKELAFEAGDAFWKVQPAYRKKALHFKIFSGIFAITFIAAGCIMTSKVGFGIMPLASFVLALVGIFGFIKGESLIKGSAKNLNGLGTKLAYNIDEENFYVTKQDSSEETLPLSDLLVCIITENLYILIWEKPYYIVDRHSFTQDNDSSFKEFISEKARIIDAT